VGFGQLPCSHRWEFCVRWFGIGMVRNVGIGGSERLCSLTEKSREGYACTHVYTERLNCKRYKCMQLSGDADEKDNEKGSCGIAKGFQEE